MREIIAVCRSEKQSRIRVARVMDRYFWRIGDRTWRGKATNACLDRVAKEVRKRATRNTALVIHEIRSSSESRKPIIRIGSRHAFSDAGVVPVSSHPADFKRRNRPLGSDATGAAAVAIAALFHDLGKATTLFQTKLRRALSGAPPEADAVRHELVSAAAWDHLFGQAEDDALSKELATLTPERIDQVAIEIRRPLKRIHASPDQKLPFAFTKHPDRLTYLIGMLILTHHRLPDADADHLTLLGSRHVRAASPLDRDTDLAIANGTPFWYESWWLKALNEQAAQLMPYPVAGADIALRGSLMFADHLGSAKKAPQPEAPEHLANTLKPPGGSGYVGADSLSRHVKRVYRYTRFAHDMTHALRERYPAIDEASLPTRIAFPDVSEVARFAWQGEAARAARAMCEQHEGGFFAALLAGTGTGKTRGAPTLLANAAMGDARPERRYLRMSLGLGLRVLATQSAKEYVDDLGFSSKDVSVLVGDPPLEFRQADDSPDPDALQGSESQITLPEWLRVEHPADRVPAHGSSGETQWLQGLSLDTDRGLPAFLDLVLAHSGKAQSSGRRLLQAPIMVGTIDHLMGVAAPTQARFLLQSLRLMTSDLILDEIDQYDGEDLAAIARLVFQAGAAGRRVVIMSATLTPDIAAALHTAYANGWADHARASGMADHVNLLLCGDAPGAVFTNQGGASLQTLLAQCRARLLSHIRASIPLRRAEVLPPCDAWAEVVAQVDAGCSRLHDLNAVVMNGYRVSVGMVRMTRIAHTTALAVQMPSGLVNGRLRLLVCLHSQLPRLHRGYIETRLKRALTRKDKAAPDRGVESLCLAEDVFARAAQLGTQEIELVVVTTPVIETGNDVDFDWAILDPISTRSIIQSAGRVCRHREARGDHLNLLILGRSPVAMQQGELAMPGVETRPAKETRVPRQDLSNFEGRHFSELAGEVDFATVTAAPLMCDDLDFPLRDQEAALRQRMISTDERDPLGRYIWRPAARWNLTMTKTRRFRRSDTREIEFRLVGDSLADAQWYLDLAPGSRSSCLRAAGAELHQGLAVSPCKLFEDLTTGGWTELSGEDDDMTGADIYRLLQASMVAYGDGLNEAVTYNEFTGFTRGTPEDLFEPFGKAK